MKKIIALTCILLFTMVALFAQSPLQSSDMRQVRIDNLSDDQVNAYYQQMQQSGLSTEQAYQLLLSRGFPPDELIKLQRRIQSLKNAQKQDVGTEANSTSTGRTSVQDTSGLNGRTENR